MKMKWVVLASAIFSVLIGIAFIQSHQKDSTKAEPIVLSEAQMRLADDLKYFRTSARTPLEHYQEHIQDIKHCQEFVAWLGKNRQIFEALDDYLNSGRTNGIDFFYDKPFSGQSSIQHMLNARNRIDIYSDFHDGTSDANFEQVHCNTKTEARLALIDDFGLSYQAWQIRKSVFERDCRDIADAGDNPYGSPTIEVLREQINLILKKYVDVFPEEIRKSITQCQQSIRTRWIDTKKQYDDSKQMQANALKWIDELERAIP